MFGLWYITFVFIAVSISLYVYTKIKEARREDYREKIDYYEQQIDALRLSGVKHGSWSYISKEDLEKIKELKNEQDKILEKLKKIRKHDDDVIIPVLTILCNTVAFILCIISSILPITAQSEVNYYIQQKEYVELAIENGEAFENIAITQIVIENNEWLAEAKASKLTYGCFSRFYNIDLSKLSPIEIKRE